MFNRAKQFTEEKMGKAERTENDPAFENLIKRTDNIKGKNYIELTNGFLKVENQSSKIDIVLMILKTNHECKIGSI